MQPTNIAHLGARSCSRQHLHHRWLQRLGERANELHLEQSVHRKHGTHAGDGHYFVRFSCQNLAGLPAPVVGFVLSEAVSGIRTVWEKGGSLLSGSVSSVISCGLALLLLRPERIRNSFPPRHAPAFLGKTLLFLAAGMMVPPRKYVVRKSHRLRSAFKIQRLICSRGYACA